MIISNVNIGSGPGANDGESIYSAFYKVNQNFANVQSNINSLTNSVSSVAGRTGNVTLTINDIVGLNTSYALNGNVTQANIGMKGYVDAKIAANVAALVDSAPAVLDTLNELAAALNDDASFSTTIVNTITLANTIQSQQIAAANVGMKGYVDSVASQSIYGNSNVASYLPTYSGNLSSKYLSITGDDTTGLNGLTVGFPGIELFGNTIAQFHSNINSDVLVSVHNKNSGQFATSGFMATADIGDENNNRTLMGIVSSGFNTLTSWIYPLDSALLGVGGNLVIGCNNYYDLGNPVKDINFVIGNGSVITPIKIKAESNLASANLVLGANVGILFNDDTRQTSAYSNVQTAAFTNLSTYAYNANVTAANLGMKGYVDSVASGSYSNVQVKSYLTQFDGNIVPSANVTYSLGSIDRQWKDLFVSNTTIFIGGVPLSIDAGGNLLVNGNAVSGGGGTATGIESASTISITNADSSADINILSGDDITIQGKNKTISDSEGGDITINAGNGGDADAGDAAGSGGDITIRAGQGGIPSAAYNGGFGGTLDLYGGTGGDSDPGNNRTARDGGRARLQAGSAGSNNGDIELGAVGGPVEITAGQTTLANAIGGAVTITSGQAGANALAGYVEINIPSSDLGQGGSWYFTGTGRTLEAPQDGEIWQPNAGNLSVASAGNVFVRSYDGVQHEWQFGHTGDLTLPGSIVNGNSELNFVASSSGDGGGYTTMQLVPDNTVTGPDQYIIIDPTAGAPAGHIHIRAGGTQDDSSANLYLGGENSYFKIPHGSNPSVTVAANSYEWTFGTDGNITFPDSTVQTTAWTGDSYSNVQVAAYLPTYTGNVAAGNVKVSTAYRFETGNVTITNESGHVNLTPDTTLSGTAGVKIGGSGFLLGPNSARNLTLNYGGISGALGIQANVTIGSGGSGNLFVVGNVIARDITGGNILATGTSGVIGFNSGGFVQQATSNATQVTSHFTSGNIQLMSIDLGASAVHTVTFACNKLTTNDILLVKHVSGGVTSVYVDAYVVSDGLAVIWMRDITGQDTGAFTPMLKYAIVRAPSS